VADCRKQVAKMSKLQELIQELCPDGVEYKHLEDVLTIKNGRDYKQHGDGDVPVYGSGGIMTYIDTSVYDKPSVLIPRKGSLDKLYYVDTPFWNVDTIFYTDIDTSLVEPKYIYYYLEGQHLERLNKAGGVPSLTQAVLNKVQLPVPPLEVQREIVRILDSFMLLTAELTAELTARKSQYEFYRNELLKVDVSIKTVALEEIADIGTGSSNTNEGLEEGLYPFYVRSQEPLRKNEYEYDETAIITAGDGVGVGKVYHYVEGKYALHQRAYRIHITTPEVLPKYYFHYMKSTFLPYIQKTMFQGSVASIRRPMLNKFPVPVPSLEVQKKIIDVLENFESICNDLNIGLPAEIEARQKQYEYYRDALLTYAATGKIIAQTDRQTDRQTSIIKLIQFVYGFVDITLDFIAENCDSLRKPVTSGNREAGEYPYYGASGIVDYVSDYIFDGDYLLVSEDGANLLARSTPIAFSISGKNWVNNHAHVLRFETYTTRRYVEFYLNSIDLSPWISGGTQPKLNQKNLNKINIPLPPLDKQERIVGILDRFDTLCNDLNSGLPAEIEARQKQYEYYRDRLLNFEPITE